MNDYIFDDNYDFSNLHWRQLEKIKRKRLFDPLISLLRICFCLLNGNRGDVPTGKILLFAGSQNNLIVLNRVAERVGGEVVSYNNFKSALHVGNRSAMLFGLLRLSDYLRAYRVAGEYVKWTMRARADRYLLSPGFRIYWQKFLESSQPKMVVVANDHCVWTRSLCAVARELNIKTAYIPHAAIGTNFPPLNFDYAFLEGEYQEDAYGNRGCTKVRVVGAVRFEDTLFDSRKNVASNAGVLLCFNKMDSIGKIEGRIKSAKSLGRIIYVKPHPADLARAGEIQSLCKKYQVEYMDLKSRVSDAFPQCGYVLAGISGVHLDGAMLGMVPIAFEEDYPDDYYGLIGNNVLKLIKDIDSLLLTDRENSINLLIYNAHLKENSLLPSDAIARKLLSVC